MENNLHRKKDSARLFWDSKPKRAANPKDIEFQTAEVVIPNPEKAGQLPMSFSAFAKASVDRRDNLIGEDELDKQKMNRLIWGDNLLAMQALLAQGYEGKINLIYIDPPFDSKADYSHKIKLGETELTKEPSVIERLAYKDTWAGGTDSYLDMLYPRLQLMKRLLAPNGSIYVHLDWHVGHYVKVMMDEIFGKSNFRNEILVRRTTKHTANQFDELNSLQVANDTVMIYARSEKTKFNPPLKEASEKQKEGSWHLLFNRANRPTMRYPLLGVNINTGQWMWSKQRADEAVANYKKFENKSKLSLKEYFENNNSEPEFVRKNPSTGQPEYWVSARENITSDTNWFDIQAYSFNYGYGTEKSFDLLERIIKMGSNENDLVADFFNGSGTTISVADGLDRRWIGCELGKVGIQVARGRLVEQESRPFLIENIGNYQREMIYLGGGRIYEMQKIILKLYGAEPMANRKDLGVRKISEMDSRLRGNDKEEGGNDREKSRDDKPELELVYCGYPDRPVAAHKVEDLAMEAQTLDGAGYKRLVILAWDYEYNYDELLQTRLKAAGKDIKTEIISRQIPPDIYEYLKKARNEEEIEKLAEKIKFFEKPYLKVKKPEVKGNTVSVGIDNYVLYDFPLGSGKKADESREELIHLVKDNFAILIDYWAIDWDYDGIVFKSQWQDFRGNGRKAKIVATKKEHTYLPAEASAQAGEKNGKHTIAMRVVDIFGNDATAIIEVKI